MDNGIILSPKELLYLAVLTEATDFMGISDAFHGMEKLEMQKEIVNLKHSLEKKGYAEMDFDGNFKVGINITEIVNTCANCDTFVVTIMKKVGQDQTKSLYYSKGEKIVQIKEEHSEYSLTYLESLNKLLADTFINIDWKYNNPMSTDIKIKSEVLSKAKEQICLGHSNVTKYLINNGCTELTASVLFDILSGKADIYFIETTCFKRNNGEIHNTMFINTINDIYELTSFEENDDQMVLLKSYTVDGAEKTIINILEKAFSHQREEDFI